MINGPVAGYTLLTSPAAWQAFQTAGTAANSNPPKSYPVYAREELEPCDRLGGEPAPVYAYLYPADLNALVAAMADAARNALGGPGVERAGWIVPHPLNDKPVHVVTKEWAEEEASAAAATLALATAGPLRLRLESDGTKDGTRVVDALSGRVLEGFARAVVESPADSEAPVMLELTAPLYGLDAKAAVYRADRPDAPAEVRISGEPCGAEPLTGGDLYADDFLCTEPGPPPSFFRFCLPGALIPYDPAEPKEDYDAEELSGNWYKPTDAGPFPLGFNADPAYIMRLRED